MSLRSHVPQYRLFNFEPVRPAVSAVMRSIQSTNTKPEILVRSILHRMGYRFRLHRRDLAGRPDIVLSGRRRIVDVRGCFWHGHGCRLAGKIPATHSEYWASKINGNRARDAENARMLRRDGWTILVVWECQTASSGRALLVKRLREFLAQPKPSDRRSGTL